MFWVNFFSADSIIVFFKFIGFFVLLSYLFYVFVFTNTQPSLPMLSLGFFFFYIFFFFIMFKAQVNVSAFLVYLASSCNLLYVSQSLNPTLNIFLFLFFQLAAASFCLNSPWAWLLILELLSFVAVVVFSSTFKNCSNLVLIYIWNMVFSGFGLVFCIAYFSQYQLYSDIVTQSLLSSNTVMLLVLLISISVKLGIQPASTWVYPVYTMIDSSSLHLYLTSLYSYSFNFSLMLFVSLLSFNTFSSFFILVYLLVSFSTCVLVAVGFHKWDERVFMVFTTSVSGSLLVLVTAAATSAT